MGHVSRGTFWSKSGSFRLKTPFFNVKPPFQPENLCFYRFLMVKSKAKTSGGIYFDVIGDSETIK